MSGDVWPKSMVPTIPPLFPAGEFDLPLMEKYCVFDLVVVGNRGPLMLACSNVHVFGEFSIFGIAFSTDFLVSHRFITLIKGCRVMGFYFTG